MDLYICIIYLWSLFCVYSTPWYSHQSHLRFKVSPALARQGAAPRKRIPQRSATAGRAQKSWRPRSRSSHPRNVKGGDFHVPTTGGLFQHVRRLMGLAVFFVTPKEVLWLWVIMNLGELNNPYTMRRRQTRSGALIAKNVEYTLTNQNPWVKQGRSHAR